MKQIVLATLIVASTTVAVFADGFLYANHNGDFGECIKDKGIPLCTADWINGM